VYAASVSIPAIAGLSAGAKRPRKRRTPHRVPCRLRVIGAAGIQAVLGETLNISATGLALQVGAEIAPGARVEVLLPHLDGEPACLYGTVVRKRRVLSGTYEIGLRFDAPR
jgi:hypothetical protein